MSSSTSVLLIGDELGRFRFNVLLPSIADQRSINTQTTVVNLVNIHGVIWLRQVLPLTSSFLMNPGPTGPRFKSLDTSSASLASVEEMKFLLSPPPDPGPLSVRSSPTLFIYLINFQMDCPRTALFAFGASRAASHLGIRSVWRPTGNRTLREQWSRMVAPDWINLPLLYFLNIAIVCRNFASVSFFLSFF